jgi:ElaB/YqjD/DUF883 family membrane-anchored ribosome-binding protein
MRAGNLRSRHAVNLWRIIMDNSVLSASNQSNAGEKLKREISGTLDDAEELVRMTADQTGEQIAAARSRIQQSLANARQELQRMQVQATETARRAAYGVDDYVHSNPGKTLGFAALLGVVVGMLIAHRED